MVPLPQSVSVPQLDPSVEGQRPTVTPRFTASPRAYVNRPSMALALVAAQFRRTVEVNAGTARVARIARIATVTISSISVNPPPAAFIGVNRPPVRAPWFTGRVPRGDFDDQRLAANVNPI